MTIQDDDPLYCIPIGQLLDAARCLRHRPEMNALVDALYDEVEWRMREKDCLEKTPPNGRNVTLKQSELDHIEIIHDGENMTASQWAKLCDLSAKQVVHRVNILHWNLKEACTTPLCRRGTRRKAE